MFSQTHTQHIKTDSDREHTFTNTAREKRTDHTLPHKISRLSHLPIHLHLHILTRTHTLTHSELHREPSGRKDPGQAERGWAPPSNSTPWQLAFQPRPWVFSTICDTCVQARSAPLPTSGPQLDGQVAREQVGSQLLATMWGRGGCVPAGDRHVGAWNAAPMASVLSGSSPPPPQGWHQAGTGFTIHSFEEGRPKRGGRKGPWQTLAGLIRSHSHAEVCLLTQIPVW